MMYTLPFSSWVMVCGASALRYTRSSAAATKCPGRRMGNNRIENVQIKPNEHEPNGSRERVHDRSSKHVMSNSTLAR